MLRSAQGRWSVGTVRRVEPTVGEELGRGGGTARCPLAAHRPAAQSTRRLDRRLRLASGLLLRGLIAARAGGDAPGSGCSAARSLRPPWPGLIARPTSLRLLCPPASACCGLRPPRGHSIACGAQISRAASPADQPECWGGGECERFEFSSLLHLLIYFSNSIPKSCAAVAGVIE